MESLRDDSTYLMRENTRNAIKNIKEKLGKIFPL